MQHQIGMNPRRLLRFLLLCQIAITLVDYVVHKLSKGKLPPELAAYLLHRPHLSMAQGLVAVAGLVANVVCWILLWRLWRGARSLLTLLVGMGIVGLAFGGPHVYSGLTEAIYLVNVMITGVVIGMLYFSDLRTHFSPPSRPDSGGNSVRNSEVR